MKLSAATPPVGQAEAFPDRKHQVLELRQRLYSGQVAGDLVWMREDIISQNKGNWSEFRYEEC
jgi:hypothetical protein